MRFTVDTAVFKTGIDIASHASSSASMNPILENILISAQYKKVILTANNLEMAIEYTIEQDASIDVEGTFTVSAKFLSSLLSLINEEKITISLENGGSIEFITPTSLTKVKGIEASKFPVIPGFQVHDPLVIPTTSLKRAIERTIFSTAEGNIRPTLAGICLQIREE